MITLSKTIRLFLDSIGRRDEYEFYLNKFQAEHSACFALLCPDPSSIEAGTEVLAFDLHFLLRLELFPAILLCGSDAERMRSVLAREPVFDFCSLAEDDALSFIRNARLKEKVPVLVAAGVELEEVLLRWVPEMARRVHFIRAAGGLKGLNGEQMPHIYTHRENVQPLEELEFDYVGLARKLLEERPGVHLSITSPINLLQEIFTVKGAGTLFRKGSTILHFSEIAEVDRARLVNLLEASFGKKLKDESFLSNVQEVYIEKDYRGAVLLERHEAGLYLSKFAVGREARGEGLALELWQKVSESHASIFWRSNASNPFNSWYQQQADGQHRSGKWQIFWRGILIENISGVIEFCCIRDEDFAGPRTA